MTWLGSSGMKINIFIASRSSIDAMVMFYKIIDNCVYETNLCVGVASFN